MLANGTTCRFAPAVLRSLYDFTFLFPDGGPLLELFLPLQDAHSVGAEDDAPLTDGLGRRYSRESFTSPAGQDDNPRSARSEATSSRLLVM